MSIQNYLNKIKDAVFGKDIREAIYASIKQCYDDAAVNHDNANMEVKFARGSHPTLNDRLTENEKNQKEIYEQLDDIANKGTTVEVLERVTKEEIDRQIKDGTMTNLTIEEDSITAEKYKDESISNVKIKDVNIDKITNSLIRTSDFIAWGSTDGITLETSDNLIHYHSSLEKDKGIISKTINLSDLSYDYLYIIVDIKSDIPVNGHLFSENDKFLTGIGDLLTEASEHFTRKTIKVSKEKILQYAPNGKIKICIAIHTIGDFKLKNLSINTNGLGNDIIYEIQDAKKIKDNSIESKHLKENIIESKHLKEQCISDKHITSVDMRKITSDNYVSLNDFVKWGKGSECELSFKNNELQYSLNEDRDGGIISTVIDMSNVSFDTVYFNFTVKSTVKIDAHIFNENGGYLGALGTISAKGVNDYVDITLRMSKNRLLELTNNLKFKLVVSIHAIGSFNIRNLKVGTTDGGFSTLPELINDIYSKINNKRSVMSTVINDSLEGLYRGKQMIKWGNSTFAYNEDDDIITFSYTKESGNAGFQTQPFAYKHDKMRLYIEGDVKTLSSGSITVYITGLKISDKSRAYYAFDKIDKIGDFHIDVDIRKILKGREPLDLNSIQILLSNNKVVNELAIKNFGIYNKFYDFRGENLSDVLNNLTYTNIKTHDIILADINNKEDFSGIWGANYTHNGGVIQYSFRKETGNACVITKDFTSKTNFIRIAGKLTGITKHSDKAGIHIYVGGKTNEGAAKYLTVGQLFDVSSFNYLVDLNYHVVYNKLDLNQPIYVMFGNINQVTVTLEDIQVYENELSDVDILGDDLKQTIINVDNEIKSIKTKLPTSEITNEISLVSPNGSKFLLNVSDNGVLNAVPVIPNKILFIGNSLLNGHGSFGMSALNSKNDYYYHVMQHLKQFNTDVVSKKIPGSPWEGSEEKSKATEWITKNIHTQDSDYDMVIVQLGDNVNTEAKNEVFKTSCKELLQAIRKHMPKARVVWAGAWYSNTTKQEIMAKSCEETGCKFINIRDLNTTENQGRIGDTITRDDGSTFTVTSSGVASHPGNKGMKAIADRLIEQLF